MTKDYKNMVPSLNNKKDHSFGIILLIFYYGSLFASSAGAGVLPDVR